uniref:Im:7138239 n=1 Tax=Eptatretus burgeri TaxID=7764 RepID=A0A8C4WUL7_EPTBU
MVRAAHLVLLGLVIITRGIVTQRYASQSNDLDVVRHRCDRYPRYIYIGRDVTGTPIGMDVGTCQSPSGHATDRLVGPATRPGQIKPMTMLEVLRSRLAMSKSPGGELSGSYQVPSCPAVHECKPARTWVVRGLGTRLLHVTEHCECMRIPNICIRIPHVHVFYPGTSQETVVDVGQCTGHRECVATRMRPVPVTGLANSVLTHVKEACSHLGACMRVPHLEIHHEVFKSSNGTQRISLKEIDVGRCLGTCSPNHSTLCLLRNPKSPHNCLRALRSHQNTCTPIRFKSSQVLLHNRDSHTLHVVTACGCK